MMFMLLFYGDDQKMTEILQQDASSLMSRHVAFNRMVQQRSRLVAAHALQPAGSTMTVRPQGDEARTVVAGPATDSRTALNGFYLINCKDMDEALEIAKLYPMPADLGYVEVRPAVQEWKTAPIVDSAADAATIWSMYADVAGWPEWMDGVRAVRLDGAFEPGTSGEITTADGEVRSLRLATVNPPTSFTMEIRLADGIWMWVGHYLTALPDGGTRITHEPVVPHAALDVRGIHFTSGVNAEAKTSVERLAARAASAVAAKAPADSGV